MKLLNLFKPKVLVKQLCPHCNGLGVLIIPDARLAPPKCIWCDSKGWTDETITKAVLVDAKTGVIKDWSFATYRKQQYRLYRDTAIYAAIVTALLVMVLAFILGWQYVSIILAVTVIEVAIASIFQDKIQSL